MFESPFTSRSLLCSFNDFNVLASNLFIHSSCRFHKDELIQGVCCAIRITVPFNPFCALLSHFLQHFWAMAIIKMLNHFHEFSFLSRHSKNAVVCEYLSLVQITLVHFRVESLANFKTSKNSLFQYLKWMAFLENTFHTRECDYFKIL